MAKVGGSIYYHYKRVDGSKFLTILSPKDWGKECPFDFLGAYKLDYDNTWVSYEENKIDKQSNLNGSIQAIRDIF